jgi:hypothetical protein
MAKGKGKREPVDEAPVVVDFVVPSTGPLSPYDLIGRLALGHDATRIARMTGSDIDAVNAQITDVQPLLLQLEEAVRERFLREGDGDVTQLAKAAAPQSMRNLMELANYSSDPKTKRAANRDVIELAGIVPPKKIEVTTTNILDQMTADELREMAAGQWPARFADQLRRIQMRQQLASGRMIDVTPAPVREAAEET